MCLSGVQNWTALPPSWAGFPEWERIEAGELGLSASVKTEDCIKLSLWPELVLAGEIDAASDAVTFLDPVEKFGAIILLRCYIQSLNRTQCEPVRLHYQLSFQEARAPLELLAPIRVSAYWPSGELHPAQDFKKNVSVSKGIDGKLKFKFAEPSAKRERTDALEFSGSVRELKQSTFVGSPSYSREVSWFVSNGEIYPLLDGDYIGGVWITHSEPLTIQCVGSVRLECKLGSKFRFWTKQQSFTRQGLRHFQLA